MTPGLSLTAARRIALAAQGFGRPRPETVTRARLLQEVRRLGVLQIDSVNVLTRSHYLPLFSRLGAYPRELLEAAAWGKPRDLFEYWGHEASLMPAELQPLFRWRMDDAAQGRGVYRSVARRLREHPEAVARALAAVEKRGPLASAELEGAAKGAGGWWGWSEAKQDIEALFWTGALTTATRRGAFERVYGLPARVLPRRVAQAPTPDRAEAMRGLVRVAARALGVAAEAELRDYFRTPIPETRAAIAELAKAGELLPVEVDGWRGPAWLDAAAPKPRPVRARALLSPFDNLIWFRPRAERLFGVRIRLEVYTPAERRTHGYYVLPFLQGETITARVDLKADRKAGALLVQAAHAEPAADAATPAALAEELRLMAGWLGLAAVQVAPRGDLASALAQAI